MNNRSENRHTIDFLFVIALLFLFAFMAVMLIALGASVYQRNVSLMEKNYETRTSYAYITEKIRQADATGDLQIGSIGQSPALLLFQEINDVSYTTYLYQYNGNLTELLTRTGSSLPAESGQPIIPVKDFNINRISDRLYCITITEPDNSNISIYLSEGAANQ
ncbi:MAG: DUF4860 domain-containing protein [Butyrivibrio sp.]|nr:DUF4860 domain-containing protein [Butyrivibrio sp.]